MKAALSRAAGYIAPNTFETEGPRVCIECGAPLESWQHSRCQSCIDKSLTGVVVANSARWATCDGVATCECCQFKDTSDCEKYHDELAAAGQGDDYGPNFWNIGRIEKILSDTQGRRGRTNSPHFLDCGDLCYIGK